MCFAVCVAVFAFQIINRFLSIANEMERGRNAGESKRPFQKENVAGIILRDQNLLYHNLDSTLCTSSKDFTFIHQLFTGCQLFFKVGSSRGASYYRHQIAARPESERCIHAADMGQTQVAAG